MRARGADFSSAQSLAQVEHALRQGIAFAFVKATEGGDYVNPVVRGQLSELHAAKVPVLGVYHFLSHDVDGATQFDHFERHFPDQPLLVACDQETDRGVLVSDAIARAFIRRGHQRGFRVGRYGDARVMGRALGEDWRWWARWSATPPAGRWDIWQFSNGAGRQDWNVYNGTVPQLEAWAHRMTRHKPGPAPKRWWLQDLRPGGHLSKGPYRLPALGVAVVSYLAGHPRSGTLMLVRK